MNKTHSNHPTTGHGAERLQVHTSAENDAAGANRRDPSDEQDERFLTTKEAAAYLRLSKSHLDKLRVYGGGPEFIRLGQRKIVYAKSALDGWARQRRFRSTSEYQSKGARKLGSE